MAAQGKFYSIVSFITRGGDAHLRVAAPTHSSKELAKLEIVEPDSPGILFSKVEQSINGNILIFNISLDVRTLSSKTFSIKLTYSDGAQIFEKVEFNTDDKARLDYEYSQLSIIDKLGARLADNKKYFTFSTIIYGSKIKDKRGVAYIQPQAYIDPVKSLNVGRSKTQQYYLADSLIVYAASSDLQNEYFNSLDNHYRL